MNRAHDSYERAMLLAFLAMWSDDQRFPGGGIGELVRVFDRNGIELDLTHAIAYTIGGGDARMQAFRVDRELERLQAAVGAMGRAGKRKAERRRRRAGRRAARGER